MGQFPDLAAANPSGHSLVDGATEATDLDKTEANKALINQSYKDVFMGENPAAFPSYFNGDNYTQHNPMIGDGVSTVMKAFQEFTTQGVISGTSTMHKLIGEGNFVLVISEANFGGNKSAIYDLFRVDNGKIAEHWESVSRFQRKINGKMKTGSFKFETKGRNLSCLL